MNEWPKAADTADGGRPRRIGYVPISESLDHPGDRRRFGFYARRRGLPCPIARPVGECDVVVLSQAADITSWSRYSGSARLVYDLVDAYLNIPPWNIRGLLRGPGKFLAKQTKRLRWSWWSAVREMCRRADAVVVGTEEQKRSVERFCPNVHLLLDSSEDYRVVKHDYQEDSVFRLVWEGLPHNVSYFRTIARVLRRLEQRHALELHLVTKPIYHEILGRFRVRQTVSVATRIFPQVKIHDWNADTCSALMTECDLGVIPIPLHDRFATGKPENKLLFLWRMGIPAVVSSIPSYDRAMKASGLEMACSSDAEWESTLERLITDKAARKTAGERGRAFVEKEHSDEMLLKKWDAVFASLIT